MNPNEETFGIPGEASADDVLSTFAVFVIGETASGAAVTAKFGLNAWAMRCGTQTLSAIQLGKPAQTSELSGRPAYAYLSRDGFDARQDGVLRLHLAYDEMVRLGGLALRPDEFKKLRDRHGIFFEIHDDFYDPETGEAVQPKFPVPSRPRRQGI